jgi:FlaG/FlaF family flagellin (archaellin)
MNRIKIVVMVILAGLFASLVTGCSSPSQSEKEDIVAFYIEFAKEATSLDSAQIREIYAGLAEQDFAGQPSNTVRDKMFAQFNTMNPEFFSKIHLTDSTYAEVGKTYSLILLHSLATEGEGVDITMPSDAVTSYEDEKLGKRVYEIDRKKITATVSESLATKLDRSTRSSLEPVKLIKDGESWKVLADDKMLTEIGTPLSEKISASTSSNSK